MRRSIAALSILAVVAPTAAFAQDVIVRERVETVPQERVIVREPSERVIVREAPAEVRRYVVREARPSVTYERRVVVGDTLPEAVDTYSVPDSDYRYTVVNNHRYLVNGDRQIIEEVED